MEQEPSTPSIPFWQQFKLLFKGTMIGILILLMLIPASYIIDLVREREQRQAEVQAEVSGKWASAQTLTGPILVVPYQEMVQTTDGKIVTRELNAYFLPENLLVKGKLDPEVRKRSLYQVILYRSDVTMSGNFKPVDPTVLQLRPEQMLPQKAHILMGLTDARGMEENIVLQWNGVAHKFSPGAEHNDVVGKGLVTTVPLTLDSISSYNFSIHLKLKGSHSFFISPSAESTQASLQSTWKDPSFDGDFLGEHVVTDSGFTAQWKLLGQNAGLPQYWKGSAHQPGKVRFGVNLIQPADGYAKTMRAAKYAILFIGLTFSLFFFIEVLQKRSVHPIQYVLIGLALSIFYTLLLSFSEYLNFDMAYIIATLATVILITLYSKSLFGKWKLALLPGVVLLLLYFFIYILLQAQDNALLFGSIGLFFTLALIMYFSRRINWYGTPAPSNS